MADAPSAPPSTPDTALAPARTRGSLTIAPRVVETVATAAVNAVPGVVPVGSGLDAVVGRRYPKVAADVAGDHATIRIDVALEWGRPLATTTAAIRDRVHAEVRDLAGVQADTVDVTVARVLLPHEVTSDNQPGRVE
ncbi:MAG: Asp23/Gls24 family envelope stress response protein [Lapillicoccus sp.]